MPGKKKSKRNSRINLSEIPIPTWASESVYGETKPLKKHSLSNGKSMLVKHYDSEYRERAGSMDKSPTPGTRVRFIPPPEARNRNPSTGTVIGIQPPEETCGPNVAICSDKQDPGYNHFPQYVGEGHGVWVHRRNVQPLNITHSDYLHGFPPHIGVYAVHSIRFRSLMIPQNATGALLELSEKGTVAAVAWHDYPANRRLVASGSLDFCYYDSSTGEIYAKWPRNARNIPREEPKRGDLLHYISDHNVRVASSSGGSYGLEKQTILRYMQGSWSGIMFCEIVGGCDPKMLGHSVKIEGRWAESYTGAFIPQGAKVEIVAELNFRRRNLQGLQGVVLLPTDKDGDIGVQFSEDVDGGSLDGLGEQGRCLYLQAEAVKKISE